MKCYVKAVPEVLGDENLRISGFLIVKNAVDVWWPIFCRCFPGKIQKGLEVCYCLWGAPSRPSPGSYPGPVQVPSRVRGGPVQIRQVLCFTAFRTHPGPEVGPSRPVLGPSCSRAFLAGSGLDGQKQTSWPLPKNCLKICLRKLHHNLHNKEIDLTPGTHSGRILA